jgi:hypothetical protein
MQSHTVSHDHDSTKPDMLNNTQKAHTKMSGLRMQSRPSPVGDQYSGMHVHEISAESFSREHKEFFPQKVLQGTGHDEKGTLHQKVRFHGKQLNTIAVRGGSTINTLPAATQYGIMSGIGQILAIVISSSPADDR